MRFVIVAGLLAAVASACGGESNDPADSPPDEVASADEATPDGAVPCVRSSCDEACRSIGAPGGDCVDDRCRCYDGPDADADVEPDDAGPDIEPDDAVVDAEPDDAAVDVEPDDAAVDVEPDDAAVDVEPGDAPSYDDGTDDDATGCDPVVCNETCIVIGALGGECVDAHCHCVLGADADADAGEDIRVDADADAEVGPDADVEPDDATVDSEPDSDVLPDDARADFDAWTEDGAGDQADLWDAGESVEPVEGGETKSGCDPLLCFMSCGGSCSLGGVCVCDMAPP
ncbi:MAG: hypothetical protein JXB32_09885 [Deltaproteobacteria bacterium]|nr:hypothetical protein [Deltaproteobacteria bacterium]